MAVKIRLTRMGDKKAPFYRVIVADSRSPRDGRYIEQVGYYAPKAVGATPALKLEREKVLTWLANGATPSDTVRAILSKEGILKEFAEKKASK